MSMYKFNVIIIFSDDSVTNRKYKAEHIWEAMEHIKQDVYVKAIKTILISFISEEE